MDHLWAIKQNVDPFRSTVFLVNYNLLAIFRCTVFRCPYCRWIFKVTWGPSNALLGVGERPCWRCKRVFWDGSNEWPEMSGKDREHFIFPITVGGWLAGFLIVSGVVVYSKWREAAATVNVLPWMTVFGTPLVVWFAFRAYQINRSIRRYSRRTGVKREG